MGVMVQSADGAAALDGLSGGLGGDGDRRVFTTLRRLPDAVVVGAGTARTENYGPPRPRRPDEPDTAPLLVVVSASLDLTADARLFEGGHRPLVATIADAPAERRRELEARAEVVTAGESRVDVDDLLALLWNRGVRLVMLEGGPALNGDFLRHDVVDEWCLTLDPVVVGGDAGRIVRGEAATPRDFDLAHVATDDGVLFVRLVRRGRD